ncbi:catechol 2,3-dioxygenase-like lactoylglutathione lyase family enzyme [Methylobacterium sp. BE186]|uniref:VOC family protein n=1 Tax=Methylobacterium sp. BE186 TaxID=2817715 RepID=UPI00285DA787|nr:VOC family protein [Methylobacterium sp. BE186]MDR7040401.1 catechol 2,3-dioxygenase-like lactoylglutathione lyase family enzyme [Methylobacterium sp. BE186]
MSGVSALVAVSRTVADLGRTEAFYRDGLGFARVAPPEPVPAPIREAMGLGSARATRLRMRLGAQAMDFLAVDPPGAPYPLARAATDPVFQHVAIPVRDMEAAMRQLGARSPEPISRGGPQRLPASSGGVTAYKFRDGDGHPVELILFPDGPAAERWRDAPGLFLGIDHSALTVSDCEAALRFFTGPLGLAIASRGLNAGPEQERLDGVPDPEVDVIGLTPPAATPHVELLHYRRPPPQALAGRFGPRDRASTRLVFAAPDPGDLAAALRGAGHTLALSRDGSAAYGVGPDGHGILFLRESP